MSSPGMVALTTLSASRWRNGDLPGARIDLFGPDYCFPFFLGFSAVPISDLVMFLTLKSSGAIRSQSLSQCLAPQTHRLSKPPEGSYFQPLLRQVW